MDERSKIEFVVGNKSFYGEEIRKKGGVNLERLYKELIEWFHENHYLFTEKDITGKETSSGRDEKVEWLAERKIDSYFKFVIMVRMDLLRIKTGNAELTLRFKGFLEKDYKDRFSRRLGKKFGEFLRRVYERYLIADKINKMMGKVWGETNDLIDRSKNILDLVVR